MFRVLLLVIISILLVSCQKNDAAAGNVTTSETTTEYAAETTTPEPETTVRKDISEYEDRTIEIPGNTFKEIAENPNLIPTLITACGNSCDTIEELSCYSEYIVRGRIIDLTYDDESGLGGTFYSFAVEEVLKGEGIKTETIVSLLDSQGYVRLRTRMEVRGTTGYPQYTDEELDKTYLITTSGEPLVEIGEEYVLFLSDESTTYMTHFGEKIELEGSYYNIISPYEGKFKLNEEGLYERFIPEFERHLYKLVDPLSLEEIKEQIAEAEKNNGK